MMRTGMRTRSLAQVRKAEEERLQAIEIAKLTKEWSGFPLTLQVQLQHYLNLHGIEATKDTVSLLYQTLSLPGPSLSQEPDV
jgi:predicted phage-related endonuclease